MLSPTLRKGLDEYGIGAKVRALRLKKKMGLVELGKHTGLSPAMLSKIERAKLHPTLPTLLRIALVFSVGLDYFFAGAREKPLVAVVRRRDRVRLPDRAGARPPAYHFESLDFPATERRFSSYLAEFSAGAAAAAPPHAHPGVEFVYVLTGSIGIGFEGDERYTLTAGDSIYFDAARPHGYARESARASTAIVVTAT